MNGLKSWHVWKSQRISEKVDFCNTPRNLTIIKELSEKWHRFLWPHRKTKFSSVAYLTFLLNFPHMTCCKRTLTRDSFFMYETQGWKSSSDSNVACWHKLGSRLTFKWPRRQQKWNCVSSKCVCKMDCPFSSVVPHFYLWSRSQGLRQMHRVFPGVLFWFKVYRLLILFWDFRDYLRLKLSHCRQN